MKSEDVERSLYRWFEEEHDAPEGFADAVHVHKPGALFPERFELWIFPRIAGFTRGVGPTRARRGEEHDQLELVVSCHVKNPPGGREDPFELSRLVDTVRAVVDASERATAAKVYDVAGQTIAVMDFGPADETRSYNESVSVGGITVPGVDSAVLTITCELSPVKPRVKSLT